MINAWLANIEHSLSKEPNLRQATFWRLITSWVDQGSLIIMGLLILPMYFHYLGVELYGYWLASGGILAWVSMIDMASVTSQRVATYYAKKDYHFCISYFWTGLCYNTIVVPVLYLFAYWLSFIVPQWLSVPKHYVCDIRSGIQLGALALAVQYYGSLGTSFLNALQRSVWVATVRPLVAISQVAVVYFGLIMGYGVLAIPAAMLTRNLMITLVSLSCSIVFAYALKRGIAVSKAVFLDYLKNGTAVLLSSLSTGIGARLQPTLVTIFVGAELAAVYDATLRVAMLAQATVSRITQALFPTYSHLLASVGDEKMQYILKRNLGLLLMGLVIFSGGYVAFNQAFIALWLGEDLFAGQVTVFFIACWLIFSQVNYSFEMLNFGSGAISRVSIIKVLGNFIQVLLICSFLDGMRCGVYAVPLSAIFAAGIMFLLHRHYASCQVRRVWPKYSWLLPRCFIGIVLCAVSAIIPSIIMPNIWSSFIVFIVGYTFIFLCLGVIINWAAIRELSFFQQ